MTKKMMDWFLESLKQMESLKQVEPYEGQFEDPEDITVFPPAALVTINQFSNTTEAMRASLHYNVSVYVVTTHMHGSAQDAMLDTIDAIVSLLHNKGVRYEADDVPSVPPDVYFGRCFLEGGSFVGVLPGMAVYRLNFIVKR
jgi:hypothetical protein